MSAPRRVRGSVINVHALGATVRLEDGTLAAVAEPDVAANRPLFTNALASKRTIDFDVRDVPGRRMPEVALARTDLNERIEPTAAPIALTNERFENELAKYLKATEEWAPADRPPPAERHLFRKKQRAKVFEKREGPVS